MISLQSTFIQPLHPRIPRLQLFTAALAPGICWNFLPSPPYLENQQQPQGNISLHWRIRKSCRFFTKASHGSILKLWPVYTYYPAPKAWFTCCCHSRIFLFVQAAEVSEAQSQAGPLCCTHLSLRSFTALTSVENSISMTVFFFRSSQIMTATVQRLHWTIKAYQGSTAPL